MTQTDPSAFAWPEGTVVEPDGTIVFRPSWETYKSKFLKAPMFLVVIAALNLWRMDDPKIALILFVVVVALGAGGTWLYFRRAITSVGPRGLLRRDLFRNTQVPKERLGNVIFVRELDYFDARVDTTLIVTDTNGKRVAMFNGPFWSAEQLYAMASALQQPTWQPEGATSYLDVREHYPKAVPLLYARPFAFGFGVAFALIFGAVVVAAVIFALTS